MFFLQGVLSAIIEESLARQFPSFWQHPRSPQMAQAEESDSTQLSVVVTVFVCLCSSGWHQTLDILATAWG